ncbi:Fungal lipase-like domain [Sesbania bispinosa]|nr:Fungal lipase-like domain [Sesbania bispinosa]
MCLKLQCLRKKRSIQNRARGLLGDNIGLKEKLIKKACALAFKAHKSPKQHYLCEKFWTSSEAYLIFSFPGSRIDTDWFVPNHKPFGERKIDPALYPSLRSIGNDEAALVNEAFLERFCSILENSSIRSKVKKALVDGKQIVFTGHSSGAAVAILATFWVLEEFFNPTKNQKHKPPLCVTFGSPLVGNHIFSHASRRENWSCYFIHFVMRFDIVPLILLAPFSSIEQTFSSILQFLTPEFKPSTQESLQRANLTSEFYSTVMRNAKTVIHHAACNLMGNTNSLLETIMNFVDLSPYRPFGTYIFCSGNGQLIVIKDSNAALQLTFHTALLDLAEPSEAANKSISQHHAYKDALEDSLQRQNVVYMDKLDELPLSTHGSNGDIAAVSAALDDLGLSTEARLCLRAAGVLERQKEINEKEIEKVFEEKALSSMEKLEEYKRKCEIVKGKGYYDSFKVQKETIDFEANVERLVLAGVWDVIIEKRRSNELPDEFEGKKEWVERGTRFLRLVEPLDIANYYRHGKDKESGPYMEKGRPKRYRYTQRWLEHSQRKSQETNYSESCFWAEVEDLASNNNSSFERVKLLEDQIRRWSEMGEVGKDVFLEDSTLVKWWKALPPQHKQESCIRSLIQA